MVDGNIHRMKREFISALLALHIIGAYAAPLLLTENNCDMYCCEEMGTNCELEQRQHVAGIDMTEQMASCEISMAACEVPVFIFLSVAPIKTIDQKFEKIVYTTQKYPFIDILSDNYIVLNLENFQIPDSPPSHLTPLLI